MSPFEERILKKLRDTRRPMTSVKLAAELYQPQSTVYYWLQKLEQGGKVARPFGRCRGFVPA